MSDPIILPDYRPDGSTDAPPPPAPTSPEQAAANVQAQIDAYMANLRTQIDAYVAGLQAQAKKDLDEIRARAGAGAGASPATPFRPGG